MIGILFEDFVEEVDEGFDVVMGEEEGSCEGVEEVEEGGMIIS